jgi:3D (Asp-Asp-Asp) domain-containing protein
MKYVTVVLAVFAFIYALDTISAIAAEFEEHGQDILSGNTEPVYHSMIATAYCLTGLTATETQTRPGIAASRREWFGKTAKVYKNQDGNVGELIGTYVIEDTGGKAIRNGSVIDIWMPTEAECFDFGRRVVFVEIID